jgi:hypothetical protein
MTEFYQIDTSKIQIFKNRGLLLQLQRFLSMLKCLCRRNLMFVRLWNFVINAEFVRHTRFFFWWGGEEGVPVLELCVSIPRKHSFYMV